MAIVTGKLEAASIDDVVLGSIDIQLCGYGSQVPRVNGESLVGRLTSSMPTDSTGVFQFDCFGNDQISPVGTYYTITVRNENGDIAQVNAYRFLGGNTYDLTLIDPYDPNQPPPPLPPLITNQLLIVPWSNPINFPGDVYTAFKVILAGDITSSTISDTVQGNLYTFLIQQDATGNHAFTWPPNVLNPSPINPNPTGFTVQTFVMGQLELISIGPATWWD